jgi:cytochrome c oxidase subunit 4
VEAEKTTTPTDAAVGTPLKAREHGEAPHPTPRKYVGVAAILAIVTAAEVGVYYVESLRKVLVWLLIGMMVFKFTIVVLWFMHVKFDNPGYGRMLTMGLALAATVYCVVLLTFGVFG